MFQFKGLKNCQTYYTAQDYTDEAKESTDNCRSIQGATCNALYQAHEA